MTANVNEVEKKIADEIVFLELLKKRLVVKTEQERKDDRKSKQKEDLAGQAILKRAMSGEPEHIRKVYEFLPNEIYISSSWEEKHIWIPVACMFVFYPQKIEEVKDSKKFNFGRSCRDLAIEINKTGESKGTERRFRALLDTSLADIRLPLANLVRQMKSKKNSISINHPQLLADLRQWEHSSQHIQDRWARSFWGAAPPDEGDSTDVDPESADTNN
jgi:CRISPR system Cascade subunit CasB